ncbi:MAG: SPOR domain-containing protein [Desulfohalobiaceae bacterium]|nr:SPOR domain-containing protein [Desulfohalobiaceae bacterium]
MAGTKKKRTSGKKQSGKRFTLTFGWSGLVSAVLLTAIALIWAFIFGVIIGRGYYPETLIPALSRIVPQKETADTPKPRASSGDPLHAEELGFLNSLSQQSEETSGTGTPDSVTSGSGEDGLREEKRAQSEPSEQAREEPARVAARYEYRYQVAALQSKKRAEKVVGELKAKGMRVDLREVKKDDVTWYRIHVRLTGGPNEAERFKQRLEGYGLGTPFLRDKSRQE